MRSRELGRASWLALTVLAITVANGLASQGLLAPLIESAKVDLQLSDFQLSLVQGLAVSIPVALLALPIGYLVDRANRTRMLVVLAIVWTCGTLLTAYAQSFAILFAARVLAGIGMMCALPVAISIGADLSPPDQRGRAMLVLSVGKIVGVAAAFAAGGGLLGLCAATPSACLVDLAPWRAAHVVFATVSIALILPLLFLREPERHERAEAASAQIGVALRAIWQRRVLLLPLFIGQVTVTMADFAAASWAAPVLIRSYQQTPQQFAGWFGAVVLMSGFIGTVIGGIAADLGQKGRVPGGLLGSAAIAAVIGVPTALFPIMPTVPAFAAMLFMLSLCGNVTGVVTATALAVLVPNDIRGLCLGLFIVVAAVIAVGCGPLMVSLVSALLGGETHLRSALAIVGVAMSALSALGFMRSMRVEH